MKANDLIKIKRDVFGAHFFFTGDLGRIVMESEIYPGAFIVDFTGLGNLKVQMEDRDASYAEPSGEKIGKGRWYVQKDQMELIKQSEFVI